MDQAPQSQADDSNKAWTSALDSKKSHSEIGNRTVDLRSLQTREASGDLKPYQDIETETVRVNATTTRTISRTFVRDDSGMKTLFQFRKKRSIFFPVATQRFCARLPIPMRTASTVGSARKSGDSEDHSRR
jgi:hypothetical protein